MKDSLLPTAISVNEADINAAEARRSELHELYNNLSSWTDLCRRNSVAPPFDIVTGSGNQSTIIIPIYGSSSEDSTKYFGVTSTGEALVFGNFGEAGQSMTRALKNFAEGDDRLGRGHLSRAFESARPFGDSIADDDVSSQRVQSAINRLINGVKKSLQPTGLSAPPVVQ